MSTHDIELPPLPVPRTKTDGGIDLFAEYSVREYARAAIEADRKRRGEPVVMREICPQCGHQFECFHNRYINKLRASPQPAAPAQEPSDDIDIDDVHQYLEAWGCLAHPGVRALLARYGHPAEAEGWQLVPKEPTEEMLAATSWPNCAGTDYKHMLAAAPKFGEEE